MATQDWAARKARIITHLNNDHQSALSLYLRHYAHLSPQDASAPTLVDISLSAMSIQDHTGVVHTIALEPPLRSWAEARERTVAMDHEARQALGLPVDDHSPDGAAATGAVTQYLWPRKPMHFAVLGILAFYIVSCTAESRGLLRPGFWFYDYVMRYFPGGPRTYLWVQHLVFWPAIGLHVGETWWMVVKLGRQGARIGSRLWWEWVVGTMIEGYGAHDRFDGLVARKGKER